MCSQNLIKSLCSSLLGSSIMPPKYLVLKYFRVLKQLLSMPPKKLLKIIIEQSHDEDLPNLPDEIWKEVFSYFGFPKRLLLRCVCKRWLEILKYQEVEIDFCSDSIESFKLVPISIVLGKSSSTSYAHLEQKMYKNFKYV